jgi:hypothetical protein
VAEPVEGPPAGLTAGIVIAGIGALLVALAPLIGLVEPRTPPAFVSWPLLLLLAGLPPALSWWFARKRTPLLAAAVLLGPAVLAPGRLIIDGQLLIDPGLAARPELLLPNTLDPLKPSVGLWLLLLGRIAALIAGIVAMTSADAARETSLGPVFGGSDASAATSRKQGQLAVVLCATVLGAVGVLMMQFASDNPYLVSRAAVDSPLPVLVGSLLVAVGIPSVGGFVASSVDREMARGGLLGLAVALAGIAVPPLFAATVVPQIHYGWGSVLGLVAALALTALGLTAGRVESRASSGELRLPPLARLLRTAGALAVVAGVLAVVGAATPQWAMPGGVSQPSYTARMLWPAGVVLVVLGIGLLLPRVALRIRPALSVAWVVLPLTAAAALDTVFAAAQAAGAQAGIGAWAAGVAGGVAGLAAVASAFAGAIERDDVDRTEVVLHRAVLVPAVLALPLAVGAFGWPVLVAPDYDPPGVFSNFGVTSWGLVLALVAVLASAVLAPVCRSTRAVALFCGAALVVLVRMLELPLTAGRVAGSGPGPGLWLAAACLVVLLIAAVVAACSRDSAEKPAMRFGTE